MVIPQFYLLNSHITPSPYSSPIALLLGLSPSHVGPSGISGLNLARMLGDKFVKQEARFSSEPYISQVVYIHQANSAFIVLARKAFQLDEMCTTTFIQPGPIVDFLIANQNARNSFSLDWTKQDLYIHLHLRNYLLHLIQNPICWFLIRLKN
ncbi:hypothetical protein POM88_043564 [Heracleum sosnowskyi]|uniref:Uncharacterized protein n=1 Tax=Heracleum sosnowskyi TaxID=360622 RepID=A0AAD8H1A3_9APIA|nr:hypothetical protein POM88_043564 [Heracleum sosnowskyi]